MTTPRTANTVTLAANPTQFGRTNSWTVYIGRNTVIGTISSPQFGTYTATVNGIEIPETYSDISAAADAVADASAL